MGVFMLNENVRFRVLAGLYPKVLKKEHRMHRPLVRDWDLSLRLWVLFMRIAKTAVASVGDDWGWNWVS